MTKSSGTKVRDLMDAQIRCRSFGHSWDETPAATWHTPQYDYIHCFRLYFRCTNGCGCLKMAMYQKDGTFVTGFTRYPKLYRVAGIGRGAGRRPFIAEYIIRRDVTPTGRVRKSDKARRQSA
jgi:hypothetical protein